MIKYIKTQDERLCCGCRACEQICPVSAIRMEKNAEGFLYPILDNSTCVKCDLCEKVCPEESAPEKRRPIEIYAVQHKNEEILKNSSSGGSFRLLADEIIKCGGCVVGCKWDINYHPVLAIADTIEELSSMQGSKYLYSDTVEIYKNVKERLDEGQQVLFTASPCQCAGLIKYLQKTYDNLITADFLCHGMPSQKAFDCYLDAIEKKLLHAKRELVLRPNGRHQVITSFKFRDKEKRGWGHVISYTWKTARKQYKRYSVGTIDSYDYGFLKGYFNRYSCFSCPFRGEERHTDFTFCDYWGVENYHKEFIVSKGVSAVSINSERGEKIIKKIKNQAILVKTEFKNVAKENPALMKNFEEKIPEPRKIVYEILEKKGWEKFEKKYFKVHNYWIKKLWYVLPEYIEKILK